VKIEEQVAVKDSTVYGGYNVWKDRGGQRGLDKVLEETLSGWEARWARYGLPTVGRSLIDGYALGMKRMLHVVDIGRDALLCAKGGVESLPDQSVLRKDLSKQFHGEGQVDKLRKIKDRQARGV